MTLKKEDIRTLASMISSIISLVILLKVFGVL